MEYVDRLDLYLCELCKQILKIFLKLISVQNYHADDSSNSVCDNDKFKSRQSKTVVVSRANRKCDLDD